MHDEATPFHTRLEILEHAIQAMQPVKTCGCSVGPDVRQAKNGERGAGLGFLDGWRPCVDGNDSLGDEIVGATFLEGYSELGFEL